MPDVLAAAMPANFTLASELTLAIPLALLFIVFILWHWSFTRRSRGAAGGDVSRTRPPGSD